MTTFDIDFKQENIRARLPTGSKIAGDANFSSGLLMEGEFDGGMLHINGTLVVNTDARLSGFAEVGGDLYVLGTIEAEKVVVDGVLYLGSSSKVSGYIVAKDFKLYAGCEVSAALSKSS